MAAAVISLIRWLPDLWHQGAAYLAVLAIIVMAVQFALRIAKQHHA